MKLLIACAIVLCLLSAPYSVTGLLQSLLESLLHKIIDGGLSSCRVTTLGKCLTLASDGTSVVTEPCSDDNPSQNWKIFDQHFRWNGKCLDTEIGGLVKVDECSFKKTQSWIMRDKNQYHNRYSIKCLDNQGGQDGISVVLKTCGSSNNANQLFEAKCIKNGKEVIYNGYGYA